ncbi:MAG: hypothetical protein RLZZ511_4038 [Cyanobacteriota bacterium]|jgi:GTPase SAR1 family protein
MNSATVTAIVKTDQSIINHSNNGYQVFQAKRTQLIQLIQQQISIAQKLDMASRGETLKQLLARVEADNFKVLVLGEFKRGKSTLINALLGAEILPAYTRPATAIINEIKWGDAPEALLYPTPTDAQPEPAPQSIPVGALERYVTIKPGMDEREAIHQNPYDKVELFWPLPLCRDGVEIIDSPGLNEHDLRQKVTMDYLAKVDAILFVMSAEALASKSELEVVDRVVQPMGHEDIFFICNRFHAVPVREREDIRQYGLKKLESRTRRGAEHIFFIDARDALDGRLIQNAELLEQSGVPQLEQALAKFLTHDRGRVKLMRPANELKRVIQETRSILPERTAMLRTDMRQLEVRYEAAQEPLRGLAVQQRQIMQRVNYFCTEMRNTTADKARIFYRSLCDDRIPTWVEAYEIQEPLNLFSKDAFRMSAAMERVIEEVSLHIGSCMEQEVRTWQEETLNPLLQERLSQFMQELNTSAQQFESQVDNIRLQLAGGVTVASVEMEQPSGWSRLAATVGGYLLGDVVTAGLGAVFGLKEMLINFVQQVALAAVTILVVGFNPLVLVPVLLGGGLVHGFIKMNSTNGQIKQKIAQKYAEELRQKLPELIDGVAQAMMGQLGQFQEAVDEGLSIEIATIREQVDAVLVEKQAGQEQVDAKLAELDKLAMVVNQVDSALDELIAEVAMV